MVVHYVTCNFETQFASTYVAKQVTTRNTQVLTKIFFNMLCRCEGLWVTSSTKPYPLYTLRVGMQLSLSDHDARQWSHQFIQKTLCSCAKLTWKGLVYLPTTASTWTEVRQVTVSRIFRQSRQGTESSSFSHWNLYQVTSGYSHIFCTYYSCITLNALPILT